MLVMQFQGCETNGWVTMNVCIMKKEIYVMVYLINWGGSFKRKFSYFVCLLAVPNLQKALPIHVSSAGRRDLLQHPYGIHTFLVSTCSFICLFLKFCTYCESNFAIAVSGSLLNLGIQRIPLSVWIRGATGFQRKNGQKGWQRGTLCAILPNIQRKWATKHIDY